MGDAALAVRQVRIELKQLLRNPASVVFAIAFPVMFLVILGAINHNQHIPELGNIDYNQYFVPGIVSLGVVGATFTNLAVSQAIRRDDGVLKRLRATPMPSWVYLAGVIGNAVALALLMTVVTIVVGALLYGVHVPDRYPGLVLDIVVGALAFSALGLAMTTVIPNGDAAPPIVNLVVLPVLFISGTFFYIAPGSTLSGIAEWLPVRHFVSTVFAAFDPNGPAAGLRWRDLGVLAAWGAGGAVVALRNFRWEPARA